MEDVLVRNCERAFTVMQKEIMDFLCCKDIENDSMVYKIRTLLGGDLKIKKEEIEAETRIIAEVFRNPQNYKLIVEEVKQNVDELLSEFNFSSEFFGEKPQEVVQPEKV